MYSIIIVKKQIVVIPSEFVQPTSKILAFGIMDKQRAYEIRDEIQAKRKIKEQKL